MKVSVRVGDRTYEVEIADLESRPVTVTIEGEQFEVWPEEGPAQGEVTRAVGFPVPPTLPAQPVLPAQPALPPASVPSRNGASVPLAPAATTEGARGVYAPIPGVIVSVSVKAGDQVEPGRVLCVLEAMKMKNSIKASRAGRLATVHVSEGQHVRHHDLLMEYEE
jgi:biotin carboxyl carrier protein